VAQVLGVSLSWNEIEKQLVAIGATVVSKPDDGRIAVDVPGWRSDITSEIDLIEEVARLHGYDSIPDDLRQFRPGLQVDATAWTHAASIRLGLAAAGLSEVQTLPLVGDGGEGGPRLLNPLSAELAFLRSALRPSLVAAVEANWAMQTPDIRLFEVGTVFARSQPGIEPVEAMHAAFVVTGARAPLHWTDGGKARRYDSWDALALFERLVALAHPGASVQVEAGRWVARRADGTLAGECGPLDADAPAWAAPLFGGEVTVAIEPAARKPYRPLPIYPAVPRDLALLLPQDRTVAEVTALLGQRGQRHHLESVAVLDEFRSPTLPSGKRSVMIRVVFRAADRTLTDTEVEQAVGRLLSSLERELDVTLRTA
jgi:phenylalanyl-tRNA synthetase beta chain